MKQIIMLLLTVASTMQADNKSDSDYIRKLIGEWQQTIKIGRMSVMTDYSYKKDGTLDSFATITMNQKQMKMRISGTWEVKDGYLISVVKSKSEYVPIPIGYTTKDKILSITNHIFMYKTEDGDTETQEKVEN